jgi:drug/metabolite transporter (DMT)-like permease
MASRDRIDWFLFLALGFMWGSSYLFIRIGVDAGLEPFTLITFRLLIGFILLATVVAISREPLPRDPRTWRHLAVMGVINIALPFSLITIAEQTVPSAVAAIINGTVPLFVIVIAALTLQDEPVTVNRLVGLLLGFVGVVVLVGGNLGGDPTGSLFVGSLLLVGSSISYAVGNVYAKKYVHGLRPMIPAVSQVGIALVVTTVLAFVFENPLGVTWTPDAALAVVWLGLFGSGLAYLAYFRVLRDWGATRTSLVAYLLPVWGIVLGAIVLNESIDLRLIAGTALIIAGIGLVNARWGRRRLFGRSSVVPQPRA